MLGHRNKVRIIGGQWRSRQVEFADQAALRPTPDRIRETLFNWLRDHLIGARCLDLFAGSGVLGIEALSRGAAQVAFVDNHAQAIQGIASQCTKLGVTDADFYHQDVMVFLQTTTGMLKKNFDVIFVDPPYASMKVPESCRLLAAHDWAANSAHIYFENNCQIDSSELPESWTIEKQKKAGGVYYYLATCRKPST